MSASGKDLDRLLHGTLLGDAMNNAEVAALLADERGYYVAANDHACELTGYSRSRLTRFRAGQLAGDQASRGIYEKLASRRKLQGRKVVRCSDGKLVACRYWGIPTTAAQLPYFILLLCGLFVARADMARWLRAISDVLPLTYAYDALARVARGGGYGGWFAADVAVTVCGALLALALGAATLRRRTA